MTDDGTTDNGTTIAHMLSLPALLHTTQKLTTVMNTCFNITAVYRKRRADHCVLLSRTVEPFYNTSMPDVSLPPLHFLRI